MLKENSKTISFIERVADIIIVFSVFLFSYYGRASLLYWNSYFNLNLPLAPKLADFSQYLVVLLISIIIYPLLLNVFKAYESMRLDSVFRLFGKFTLISFIVFLLLSSILFLLKLDFSRSFLVLFCTLMIFALSVERVIVLKVLRIIRKKGFNYRNIMIVGFGNTAVDLARKIKRSPELGLRIRVYSDLRNKSDIDDLEIISFIDRIKSLGVKSVGHISYGLKNYSKKLIDYPIDEVIFTSVNTSLVQVKEAMEIAHEQGIRTCIAGNLFDLGLIRSGFSNFENIPLIHYETPPGDRFDLKIKRFLDFITSLFLVVLLSPIFIIIWLLVKFDSKGAGFFVQKRVGLNGRTFNMYKFRTMYLNSDLKKDDLNLENEMTGPVFKIKDDPRVTNIGKFLRKFSLDELPQLFNVLIGEMSLVGPRPPVVSEVNLYLRHHRRRLSMRPGLTCIWQVSGRNNINKFEDWVKLDLKYIDNWSLFNDFRILVKTIPEVFLGKGS